MKEKFTFRKAERLKSRKQIELLFRDGENFFQHPFKVHFALQPYTASRKGACLQTGVGTNTRYFRKAVDRNRIKRLIREAYRIQKHALHQQLLAKQLTLDLFLVYVGKDIPAYLMLKEKLQVILNRLILRIDENHVENT